MAITTRISAFLVSCLLVLISVHPSEAFANDCLALQNQKEHIIRDSRNRGLVVFVHGFSGQQHETWGYFPKLLCRDSNLEKYDYLFWGYPTGIFSQNPNIRTVGDALKTRLRRSELDRYNDIVFVAHSMGGLVVRSYILEALQRGAVDEIDRIKRVVLVAVPNMGLDISRSLPQLVGSWLRQEVRDMRAFEGFISDLTREWVAKVYRPTSLDRYHRNISTVVAVGLNDTFVPKGSVRAFFEDVDALPGDHSSVVKPRDDLDDIRYVFVRDSVLANREISRWQLRIRHISASRSIAAASLRVDVSVGRKNEEPRITKTIEYPKKRLLPDMEDEVYELPSLQQGERYKLYWSSHVRPADSSEWLPHGGNSEHYYFHELPFVEERSIIGSAYPTEGKEKIFVRYDITRQQ